MLVAFGLPLAGFGFDGWDLPVQIANTAIPYPFTFLQAALVNLGVIYLVLFAMISLTLLLSYRSTMPELGKYLSYQFSGIVADAFTMRAILYAVLTVVMLPLAKLGFKKHQAI